MLAPFAGTTVIRATVERVCASSATDVVALVFAATDGPRIVGAVDGLPLTLVPNPAAVDGMSTSLRAGIQSLGDDVGAAVIALGDQPSVDPTVIDRVIAAWRAGGHRIVAPRYRDGRGHPVLFARALFSELVGLMGDVGARDVVARHAADVRLVDIDADAPPDIDTHEDLARAEVEAQERMRT